MEMDKSLVSEAKVILKKGEGRTIKAGGAWIFDNEIDKVQGSIQDGEILSVEDFDGYFMGYGFINSASKIRVRMLSRRGADITPAFLKERVEKAWAYRKAVLKEEDLSACRVLFGEADFLPGLVIDKYENVLVVESLALGIDKLKPMLVSFLVDCMKKDKIDIKAVYERSDAPVRKKEGMQPFKGIIPLDGKAATPEEMALVEKPILITENNVKYLVDVINGQKTGFFLDQKYNRLAMQKLVKDFAGTAEQPLQILDCFTHMGTFALNCGLAIKESEKSEGASVVGLDISEFAVSQATENAKRNELEQIVSFRAANVLDELPRLKEQGAQFDVVILDPPAFTKSREATKNAIKGYREINMKGLQLIRDGGFLATCSCSHFMTQELLEKTVKEAAKAVHKRLRQVEFRTQAPDHPILWNNAAGVEESYYLKFFIFQVVDEK